MFNPLAVKLIMVLYYLTDFYYFYCQKELPEITF